MPTVRELTEPKSNYLLRPLISGNGFNICRTCYIPIPDTYSKCYQCTQHDNSWLNLADIVVPISMAIDFPKPDKLRQYPHELKNYKIPGHPAAQDLEFGVTALLWRWLERHEGCVVSGIKSSLRSDYSFSTGVFDIVSTVPSTRGRQGTHPLENIVKDKIPLLRSRYESLLVPGSTPPGSRLINPDTFRIAGDSNRVSGKSILLIDDTWTTGAKAQSAANTLKAIGASAVAVLVLGRWMSPTISEPFKTINNSYIGEILNTDWDWDICVLE